MAFDGYYDFLIHTILGLLRSNDWPDGVLGAASVNAMSDEENKNHPGEHHFELSGRERRVNATSR